MTILHSVKKVLPVLLICAVVVPVCSAGTARSKGKLKHPTVSELLDKFAETQDKLKSFVAKGECSSKVYTFSDNKPEYQHYSTFDGRVDENRAYTRTYAWGDINPTMHLTKDKAYYASHLWDGKDYYAYNKAKIKKEFSKGTVFLLQNAEDKQCPRRTSTFEHFPGSSAMGHLRKTVERIDTIIRKADSVRVRDKMEKIGDSDCYVIEAKARTGDYTVWIDPAHGYNIAKAEVRRGPGDVLTTGYVLPENDTSFSFLKNVRFKKMGDLWVPTEAEIISGRHKLNSRFNNTTSSHYKITEIELNPDHDTLGSFVPDDILNGAKVRILKGNSLVRIPGRYTWQDGQVVDENGRVIMDCRPKKASGSAKSKPKSAVRKRPSAWELLRKYAEQQAKVTTPQSKERVVHFPRDRSIGSLYVVDRVYPTGLYWDWLSPQHTKWLAEAQGDVRVPANKMLRLDVRKEAWQGGNPFAGLKPDDIQILGCMGYLGAGDSVLKDVACLTGLEVLDLTGPQMRTKGRITGTGLKHLARLEKLKYLYLSGNIRSEYLAYLRNLPSLECFYFSVGPSVTNIDAKMAPIGKLTSLTQLHIGGGNVGKGLAHLKNLKSLRYLSLISKRNDDINKYLAHLSGLTELEELVLKNTPVCDASLVHLKGMTKLKKLNLSNAQINGAGLVHLRGMTNLEELDFSNTQIEDKNLVYISGMTKLRKLDLSSNPGTGKITDAGMVHLKNLKSLEQLKLPYGGISDVGLSHLTELSSLKKLNVYSDSVTDEGLANLVKLKSLKELDISCSVRGRNITDAGMEKLSECTCLKALNLQYCPITDKGLAQLAKLKSLTRLRIYKTQVTGDGLAVLKELPLLKDLTLNHMNLGETGIAQLAGLKSLERLNLSYLDIGIRNEDLAHLAGLTSLKFLDIRLRDVSESSITNNGLAHLSNLTNLEFLRVSGNKKITDAGLKHLSNLKNLELLWFYNCPITDAGLKHLEGLTSLRTLVLLKSQVTEKGMARLKKKIPRLMCGAPRSNVKPKTRSRVRSRGRR